MNLLLVQSPSVMIQRVYCGNKSLPLSLDGAAFLASKDYAEDWCDRFPSPPVSPWERTGIEFPTAELEELSRRSKQNLFYTFEKAQLLRDSFDVGVVLPPKKAVQLVCRQPAPANASPLLDCPRLAGGGLSDAGVHRSG
jgi:hypothetical protein